MKKNRTPSWKLPALAGLAMAIAASNAAPLITVSTYDDATPVTGNTWVWWGGCTISWDGGQDHTGNGGGSLYMAHPVAAGADSIMVPETWLSGSGTWWGGNTPVDLTTYTNVSFWLKWDSTNSSMPISTFNSEGAGGLNFALVDKPNSWDGGTSPHFLGIQPIPNAASNGWVHFNYPISSTIPFIDQIWAIAFNDWKPAPWSGTVAFWVDDITIQPSAVDVIPPPTMDVLAKITPGLQVFNSTAGVYDRQEAMMVTNTSLSWVGRASAGNPVTYSFTIADYPNSVNCEGYLFLVPNQNAVDSAPDWNETNCLIAYVQGGPNWGNLHLQYKVNEDHQNAMYGGGSETRIAGTITNHFYYTAAPGSLPGGAITNEISPTEFNITNESGSLGMVTNPGVLGTWQIKFTSDTAITLIAPNGNSTNVVIPSYNTPYFADTTSMNIFLGGQANNADALNQAVVYSDFSIAGVPNAIHDHFASDSVLDTNAWTTSPSAGAKGVFVAPSDSKYLMKWTLPDGGFTLKAASSLTATPSQWGDAAQGPVFTLNGKRAQVLHASEIPVGETAFFRLNKAVYTQLQVLCAGETNAPNTPTGKVGTPLNSDTTGTNPYTITVHAVDPTFHIVTSANDSVNITTTDGSALLSPGATVSLSSGTGTVQVLFGTAGTQTVTATDTNTTFTATSAPITVQ